MQVNSAQDWLTRRKRQVIAKTFYTSSPAQENKLPSTFLSVMGNNATTRERFIIPAVSAWGGVPGTATYTNFCVDCSTGASSVPGVFTSVNTRDVLSRQALKPIGKLTPLQ
jgi:hypothetical protein